MNANVNVCGAAAFAALAIVVLLGAGPSRPVQSVTYSSDGESWSPVLGPLFDKDIRWVPGDQRSAQFHVFNDTDDDGRLIVSLDSATADLAKALKVTVAATDQVSECARVSIPAHQRHTVAATVHMDKSAGNATQSATAAVDLVVQWDNRSDELCAASAGAGSMDRPEGAQP